MQSYGNPNAPLTLVCEPGSLKTPAAKKLLWAALKEQGYSPEDCYIVYAYPTMPEHCKGSDKEEGAWIAQHRPAFLERMRASNSHMAVAFGKLATRACSGRAVKITRVRGQAWEYDDIDMPVLTVYSSIHVLRRPELLDIFYTDLYFLHRFAEANYDYEAMVSTVTETDYQWCTDLQFLLDNRPAALAVDTETTGLNWYRPEIVPLTVQLSWEEGKSVAVPVHMGFWPGLGRRDKARIVAQLRDLLTHPGTKCFAHNMSYDHHILGKLGIHDTNWWMDTQIMAFAADDNMQDKSQDECVRRWVPEMAGYADCVSLDAEILTADMRKVRADSLKPGDELCAFTATTSGKKATRRKMTKAVVQATQVIERECLRITTASGRVTTVSAGHLMLCKRGLSDKGGGWRWRRADKLTIGSVLKPFPWKDPADGYKAGYVSGLLDGEGWQHKGRNRVGFAQRRNRVLDKFIKYTEGRGFVAGHNTDKRKTREVVNLTYDGWSSYEVLQTYRPARLLDEAKWEGAGLPTNANPYDPITHIEPVGVQKVVGLKTSTQTIIADGLCSHNSFNRTVDKGDMINVPKPQFLEYACGDADALFRLCKALTGAVRRDRRQWNLLNQVQMPALRAFSGCVEDHGVLIDTNELAALQAALEIESEEREVSLMNAVPPAVKRKHLEKGLKFTRHDFIRDILFSEDGFGLVPRVFTKGSQRLPEGEKIPSTSAKDHLPYFDDHPWVEEYMEWSKVAKMRSTYVGSPFDEKKGCPTGFWQYLHEDRIHPTFNLHGTVTGRTSSRNPNAQNFPKRGRLAKAYRKCFVPTPGYVFVESDLSQAELRVAAWMAHESNMLQIYADDGDIHSTTAAAVLGVPLDTFMGWKGDDTPLIEVANSIPGSGAVLRSMTGATRREFTVGDFVGLQRFRAKAVNFGFLYGMGWRKFRVYAKTDYGLEYTDEEAQHLRDTFFNLYPGLQVWHSQMEEFVREHGYVRALHGALRRLPSVYSVEESFQWSAIRQAINSPVQRFASDLGLISLARMVRDCPQDEIRPVLFIHDALIVEVREDKVPEYLGAIRFYMESNPLEAMFGLNPPIPIKADVAYGPNMADMEEINVDPVAPDWYQPELDEALAA